ncbi:hypothetical protein BH11BAC2_BH11BAC2_18380 [soil metagenome]
MSRTKQKVLILYFELAGYVVACLERLAAKYEVEIHLIRYPVQAVAPFNFNLGGNITVYERRDFSDQQLIELTEKINPDLVYCCGWSDKGYVSVCRGLKKRIPILLAFDNPWLGTLKQRIASIAGPLYLPSIFTHCWVPGEPNAVYARKLGFKGNRLFTGMYSADVQLFENYYQQIIPKKKEKFPHRFLYVGRYTALKGFTEMLEAFTGIPDNDLKDWELWCLGKGELENEIPKDNPRIKNFGFVQPDALAPYLEQTGVFILPTHYEHWGVVVHEFAAAGFPLICSTTTSAATTFLHEGENGFFTKPKSMESIREVILKVISKNDNQLFQMGERSKELAKQISPDTWSDTIWNLIKEK